MSTQPAAAGMQFTLDFSQRLPAAAQEGMARADANADPRWRHIFDGCVLAAARKRAELTSDDVLEELEALPEPPGTHNLSAIGAAMLRAEKMGLIVATEAVKRSQRKEKKGNLHRVWRSRCFELPPEGR